MSKHSTFQIGFIVKRKKKDDKKEDNNNLHSLFQERLLWGERPTCIALQQVPLLERVKSCRGGGIWGDGDEGAARSNLSFSDLEENLVISTSGARNGGEPRVGGWVFLLVEFWFIEGYLWVIPKPPSPKTIKTDLLTLIAGPWWISRLSFVTNGLLGIGNIFLMASALCFPYSHS